MGHGRTLPEGPVSCVHNGNALRGGGKMVCGRRLRGRASEGRDGLARSEGLNLVLRGVLDCVGDAYATRDQKSSRRKLEDLGCTGFFGFVAEVFRRDAATTQTRPRR